MKFKLQFDMNTTAFKYGPEAEIVRILNEACKAVLDGLTGGSLQDFNDDTIGNFEIAE